METDVLTEKTVEAENSVEQVEKEKTVEPEKTENIVEPEKTENTENTDEQENSEKPNNNSTDELLHSYKLNHFMSFFFLEVLFSNVMCILLVHPKVAAIHAAFQLIFLNIWIYGVHRLSHKLPDMPLNYHLYIHHNKSINLPRPVELFFEFITNISWFLPLLILPYVFNIHFLSPILIVFIGLWYSSIHVLNLSLGNSIEHKIHHKTMNYNYGPSITDYIFDTLKVNKTYNTNSEIPNGLFFFFLLKALKPHYFS